MPATILLADDNADNRAIYGVILNHYGYRVLYATDGNDAVRVAREALPDLVLMDLVMPHLDGLAATRLLRSEPATGSIPIVMLTAHPLQSDRDEARAAGCESFLLKPVEPRRVLEEVRRVLDARSNGDATSSA